MTIPSIGVICAVAMEALAPPLESFAKGRDFAAWLGLTPRQNSSGGKTRLGGTSKMGQRDLRRLLVSGAVSVVRWASRKGAPEGSWHGRMLKKKPRLVRRGGAGEPHSSDCMGADDKRRGLPSS
jgi:transposase